MIQTNPESKWLDHISRRLVVLRVTEIAWQVSSYYRQDGGHALALRPTDTTAFYIRRHIYKRQGVFRK